MSLMVNFMDKLSSIKVSSLRIRDKLVSMGLATSADDLASMADTIHDLPVHSGETVNASGSEYVIPAGYHDGTTKVTGTGGGTSGGSLETVTLTPSTVTQKVTPNEGYVGFSEVTVQPIPSDYVYGPELLARLSAI